MKNADNGPVVIWIKAPAMTTFSSTLCWEEVVENVGPYNRHSIDSWNECAAAVNTPPLEETLLLRAIVAVVPCPRVLPSSSSFSPWTAAADNMAFPAASVSPETTWPSWVYIAAVVIAAAAVVQVCS